MNRGFDCISKVSGYIHKEPLEENRIIFREFEALEDEASMPSHNDVNQPTLRRNSEGQRSHLYRGEIP